jgi:hypothetical protein
MKKGSRSLVITSYYYCNTAGCIRNFLFVHNIVKLGIEKEASYIVTVISLTKPNPEGHPSAGL